MEPTKTTTNASQTEEETNRDLCRAALISEPSNPIYPLSNLRDSLSIEKNLCQMFGKKFLAEATHLDCQMAPFIKLIRDREWETLKRGRFYF